jgi:hypothetical protein
MLQKCEKYSPGCIAASKKYREVVDKHDGDFDHPEVAAALTKLREHQHATETAEIEAKAKKK